MRRIRLIPPRRPVARPDSLLVNADWTKRTEDRTTTDRYGNIRMVRHAEAEPRPFDEVYAGEVRDA